MAIYVKESGAEVEVNDSSVAMAESLGWKLKKAAPKKAAKKAKAE